MKEPILTKGIPKERFSLDINEIRIMRGWEDEIKSPYEEVDNKIHSTDEEDGGYEATMVIQRKADEKYFACDYTGWQIDHNDDEPFDFIEVEKKTKTITYYE